MPSLIATLGANIAPFMQGMDQAKGGAQSAGKQISSALGGELSRKLGSLVGIVAIEQAIQKTVEYGSKIQDLSNRLGISVVAVQEWDYALKQNGSSIEAAAGFFEKLSISREKALAGNGEAIAAFQKLGVSIDDLKNKRIEDVAKVIAKGFQLGDPQALISSLREVGGKGAGEMAAAFRDGLADALDQAPLISPESIASLDQAADGVGRLKAEFLSGLAPAIAACVLWAEKLWTGLNTVAGASLGFVTGAWQKIKDAPSSSLIEVLSAGKENAGAMFDQSVMDWAKKEFDAKAKADRLRAPLTADFEESDPKGAAKAQKAADAYMEKAEKIAAAQLEKAEREEERYDKEMERLERKLDQYSEVKPADYLVNSLQQIGGIIGGFTDTNEIQMVEANKKSEQHLSEIKKDMKKLVAAGPHDSDDAKF